MKKLALLFVMVAISMSLSAQNLLDYYCRLRNEKGSIITDATVFVEIGKTDENGQYKINARYNTNLLIKAAGYNYTGLVLKADPIQRVAVLPATGKKYKLEYPEALKSELEYPLYVVNGVFVPSFKPYNYTNEQIAEVTTTKRWNKITKEIFKDTDIENIDVAKRGVMMITTKENITFNAIKNKIGYTIIAVDKEGKPIEGASIYIRRGKADKVGDLEFSAKAGRCAVITSAKYENYSFKLTEQREIYISMTKKPEKEIDVKQMPSFNGGSISQFRQWFMNYANEEMQKCIQSEDTYVVAKFIVGKSGKVVCVEIVKHNNPRAARVVKNAIYRSPQWSPGIENGKPVNVAYTLPITIGGTAGY